MPELNPNYDKPFCDLHVSWEFQFECREIQSLTTSRFTTKIERKKLSPGLVKTSVCCSKNRLMESMVTCVFSSSKSVIPPVQPCTTAEVPFFLLIKVELFHSVALWVEGGQRNWQDYDGADCFIEMRSFGGRRVWASIPSGLTMFNVVQVLVTRQMFYRAHLNKCWWEHVLRSSAFPWAVERCHNCKDTPGYYLTNWGSCS